MPVNCTSVSSPNVWLSPQFKKRKYAYTHTRMYICIYTYMYVCTHMCIHTYTYMYINIYMEIFYYVFLKLPVQLKVDVLKVSSLCL